MPRLYLLALFALGGLAGCAPSPTDIVLRNPQTGQIMQCRSRLEGASPFPIAQQWIDSEHAEDCAHGFVAAGWQRMN